MDSLDNCVSPKGAVGGGAVKDDKEEEGSGDANGPVTPADGLATVTMMRPRCGFSTRHPGRHQLLSVDDDKVRWLRGVTARTCVDSRGDGLV